MTTGNKKVATVVDECDIHEVVEFLDAKDALDAFKESNAALLNEYNHLVERYNTAMQNADKAVRAQQVTCGPWKLYSFSTKYDVETLYNAVGRDAFLSVGGTIGTKVVYDIDKGLLEAAIAQGKLPPSVINTVRKISPTFHAPQPAVLP